MNNPVVLDVSGLTVGYRGDGQAKLVVRDFDLKLHRGEIVGLAGESGCGKSTAALAMIGYRAPGVLIESGIARLGEFELLSAPRAKLRGIWGRRIAHLSQNAATSVNPALTIGRQMLDVLRRQEGISGQQARIRAAAALRSVGLAADGLLDRYIHQFSGGQQQRIALATATVCRPDILILDEPTTGLDVATQAQISRLVSDLVEQFGLAVLYVSHDLGLLGQITSAINIMYGGRIVETGPTGRVLQEPTHPYTQDLLACVPDTGVPLVLRGIPGAPPPAVVDDRCAYANRCRHSNHECETNVPPLAVGPWHEVLARCHRQQDIAANPTDLVMQLRTFEPVDQAAAPLLATKHLCCTYGQRGSETIAVPDVSFELRAGESLAVVGESGSGKSTVLRAIAGLRAPRSGSVDLDGVALAPNVRRRTRAQRGDVQLIFQNADLALNPRHLVEATVLRPLCLFEPDLSQRDRDARLRTILDDVRLTSSVLRRYPHELSGGQRQRVAIARALVASPRVLLCDEVTSALDVSVQAAIVELLVKVAAQRSMALLFVTHDLGLVRSIAARALVMRNGQVCEEGPVDAMFAQPTHPYTAQLIASIPRNPRQQVVAGSSAAGEDEQ